MGVEESVYLAKLAEQAERYEGGSDHTAPRIFSDACLQKWLRT